MDRKENDLDIEEKVSWCGYDPVPGPCPFCGSLDLFPEYSFSSVTVNCFSCGCVGPCASDPDGTDRNPYQVAIDLWNGIDRYQ